VDQEWYYIRDGAQLGPLTAEEMSQMIADRQIAPGDLVWKQGMPQWEPALHRPEFFGQPEAPPPPLAPVGAPAPVGMLSYQSPPLVVYGSPVHYAGFWRRVGARLLDSLILLPVGLLVSFLLGTSPFNDHAPPEREGLDTLISVITQWLYFALQESSTAQATLGKRALGIVVTDLYGNRISFGRATGRHFAEFLSAIILCIGYLMAGFTKRKQALHDMIASCLVICRPKA
jgi:uncharacterized RDD family membrane protein YckC